MPVLHLLRPTTAVAALLAAAAHAVPAQAVQLSDNLSTRTGGSENASATQWLAASFIADDASGLTATLAMSDSTDAVLSLYGSYEDALGGTSDLIPDTALATFGRIASDANSATFELGGLSLTSGSTYWLVLSSTGSTDWSWSLESTGSGTGFTGGWSIGEVDSEFGETVWYTQSSLYPLQFSVASIPAVPEPSSAAMLLAGLGMVTLLARRRASTLR